MFHKKSNQEKHNNAKDKTFLAEIIHPQHHPKDPRTSYSLAHVILGPGKESSPHKLTSSIETYIITRGKGLITVDNEKEDVSFGSVVVIPPDSIQYIQNTGVTDLEFYCIVSPPWCNDQDTRVNSATSRQ